MSDDISITSKWDCNAPDLNCQFPSLEQQYAGLSPVETKMSDTLPNLNSSVVKLEDEGLSGYLILNGLSYHVGGREYMDSSGEVTPYNEVNLGAGLQVDLTDNILLGAGVYDNSYGDNSAYLFISYETDSFLDNTITVGVDAGIIHGYEGRVPDELLLTGGFVPMVAPFISVKIAGEDSILPDGTNIKVSAIPLPEVDTPEGIDPVDAIVTAQIRVPF